MKKTQTNLFKRSVRGRVVAVTSIFVTLFAGALMAQTNQSSPGIRNQIEDLMTCYAYGSDALAKAVAADAGPEDGLSIYEGCLADDWTMTIVSADGPIVGPFNREVWANVVYATFLKDGVVDGQHLMGSVQIESMNGRGTMSNYAIVNLVDATNVRTQIISYINEVERRSVRLPNGKKSKRWVITSTTLEMTAESASPKM